MSKEYNMLVNLLELLSINKNIENTFKEGYF